ncbi:L-rhamnose mutarotase [Streptomyces sp. ISL-99]|nr:L-rhamnose mutarotase [Streptomyces sp. ISL-99]
MNQPDMLEALSATGWHNYSLFLRDDGLLVGYLETEDFARAQAAMAATEVNARWQAEMGEFFEALDGDRPDEAMKPLTEVFHLAQQNPRSQRTPISQRTEKTERPR